jgi:hypothetical protein
VHAPPGTIVKSSIVIVDKARITDANGQDHSKSCPADRGQPSRAIDVDGHRKDGLHRLSEEEERLLDPTRDILSCFQDTIFSVTRSVWYSLSRYSAWLFDDLMTRWRCW